MIEVEKELAKRLKRLRARIDVHDGNTLFLRNVPARKDRFNKSRTNLLIKRPEAGLPFLVCVDEDLEYMGTDDCLLRVFTGAHRQQGWRIIYLEQEAQENALAAVENALRALGFDGEEPALAVAVNDSALAANDSAVGDSQFDRSLGPLLASFGIDISQRVREGQAEPTIGREEKIEEIASALLQWQARLPIIYGESGVGKTNLLYGVARKLSKLRLPLRVIAVDLGVVMAGTLFDSERENLLSALLKEALATPATVLAMEHLELALSNVPRGPWLLAQSLEQNLKLVGTMLDVQGLLVAPLSRRIQVVELDEPWPEETELILLSLLERIALHHNVRIDESILNAALENAHWIQGCFPAKAVNLLDAAASRAALAGKHEVSLSDIYFCVSMFPQATGA
jgi:ATP-dependent Clp protease ATP-binding subunit ClpA